MSLYEDAVPQLSKMLGNLSNWLDEAQAYAEDREYPPARLLDMRLAPDQFDLTRQVQAACDTAKLAGARIAGVDAPVHADGRATLAELKERIAEVRDFLGQLDREALERNKDIVLRPAFLQGAGATASDYLREFAVPNFYFHLTTAYAILRHCGVGLGKRAFIGSMTLLPPE